MDAQGEDSDEEDLTMELMEEEHSSVAIPSTHHPQEGSTEHSPTKYQIESGLTMGVPSIMNHVTASLLALKPSMTRTQFKVHDEITKILEMLSFLEAYKVQRELLKYLSEREENSGEMFQDRINWNVSNPSEILDALQIVKRKSSDNKIHRAYGQMMLFSSVRGQVAQGYKSTITGHRYDHIAILEELTRKKYGSLSKSETDQMIRDNLDEYNAGQKWLAVVDWFGGSGIVLVFVTAGTQYFFFTRINPVSQTNAALTPFLGIGPHFVEKKWTEFQRICMQHIAGLLPNIRELVAALGSDALELYCRYGCLGPDCIKRLVKAEFTEPDGDDEESEDDEEGKDDEESEGDEKSGDGKESEYSEESEHDEESEDDSD